jgi:hypothetical protein
MKPSAAEYANLLTKNFPPRDKHEEVYASAIINMARTIEAVEAALRIVGQRIMTPRADAVAAREMPVDPAAAQLQAEADEIEDMPPIRATVAKVEPGAGAVPPKAVVASVSSQAPTA